MSTKRKHADRVYSDEIKKKEKKKEKRGEENVKTKELNGFPDDVPFDMKKALEV